MTSIFEKAAGEAEVENADPRREQLPDDALRNGPAIFRGDASGNETHQTRMLQRCRGNCWPPCSSLPIRIMQEEEAHGKIPPPPPGLFYKRVCGRPPRWTDDQVLELALVCHAWFVDVNAGVKFLLSKNIRRIHLTDAVCYCLCRLHIIRDYVALRKESNEYCLHSSRHQFFITFAIFLVHILTISVPASVYG